MKPWVELVGSKELKTCFFLLETTRSSCLLRGRLLSMYHASGFVVLRGCEGVSGGIYFGRILHTAYGPRKSDKLRSIVPFFGLLCLFWRFLLLARTSLVLFSGNQKMSNTAV